MFSFHHEKQIFVSDGGRVPGAQKGVLNTQTSKEGTETPPTRATCAEGCLHSRPGCSLLKDLLTVRPSANVQELRFR